MTIRFQLVAIGCFVVGLTAHAVDAQQSLSGRQFTDKTNGYKIVIPSKWVRLPTNVEEKWIVAHFQSKKEYVGSAKAGDSLMGHKPYLKIILFDDDAIRKMVEVEKSGNTTIKTLQHPYRDYKDYIKRNLGGGGYYFEQEQKGEVRGVEVMKYQIKLEKLTNDKKRYVAWVFAAQGRKFAVEFEVLESQYNRMSSMLMSALRTFKLIERSDTGIAKEDPILKRRFSKEEWAKLSAKERLDIRKKIDAAREKKMIARLPEGWTTQKSKHFLVLTHGGKKFTKRIVDAAETFRRFLNKRFDKLTDEYAMQAVIRICKNADEYRSYYSGSSETSFNFRNREIVTYNDYTNVGLNSGSMFWDIYGFYMQDKAPELVFSTPIWLDSGLNSYVASATLKGRRLVLERSVDEFVAFAELRRMKEGSIKTAKEIMNLDTLAMFGDPAKRTERQHLGAQVATFFRFMEGPAQNLKFMKGRDYIVEYMQAVLAVAKKFDDRAGITVGAVAEAQTEEEEERQAAQSGQRWKEYEKQAKARRAEFLVELAKKMDQWSEEEWAELEEAYTAYHSKKTR